MNHDDIPANPRIQAGAKTIEDIISLRYSRRGFLKQAGLLGAISLTLPGLVTCSDGSSRRRFNFAEISRGTGETHSVAEGYDADILLRWGDPLFTDSPAFDPLNQTAAAQERQFGFNNDFIGFIPLEQKGRGLLFVNHEYTVGQMMFSGIGAPQTEDERPQGMTADLFAVERAAHGVTIIEIEDRNGGWFPVVPSPYNRRITGDSDGLILTGPAAGHERLKTSTDPAGRHVRGTLNNCAGGVTPWGTFLTAEENFGVYFSGQLPEGHKEATNYARYGLPSPLYDWGRFEPRFDLAREPNEPNRFGWIVEIDPHDPASSPKKRTALGRFKHEGAECIAAPNGKIVIYMGDDQRFDYVYKFVTAQSFDAATPEANRDLLDDGTLYVARFNEDGTLNWMPLIYGTGPLNEENGFASQADMLIETRRAADLLGATPMDRPEDIEPNPLTGRVYVMLTNNSKRKADGLDSANPRAENMAGHIIEIVEPEGDFSATASQWNLLVLCGDPGAEGSEARWNTATTENGWFGSPDNCAIDPQGRLWIATDGNPKTGANDGLWALETEGPQRGTGKAFFRAPDGAEVTGPRFTPDGRTLFLSIQHPGEGEGSTYAQPVTRWPDFVPSMPPRPSVMAIRRKDGGMIGS